MLEDAAMRRIPPGITALAGMIALAAAMGIGRFAFTPLLPMMMADAGLTVEQGGWLASANYAGYFAGALTAAVLRLPSARIISAGLLAIAAATAAMGLVHDALAWLALRFLAGMASAWVMVHVSASALARLDPAQRPLLRPVVFSGVGTGIALAGALCLAAMTASMSSNATWILLGGLALMPALLLCGLAFLPASLLGGLTFLPASLAPHVFADPAEPAAKANRVTPAADGKLRDGPRLVVCYGVFGFGYIIPATFLPAMARTAVNDPSVFGWSWPIFGAAAALSTLGAAYWRRRSAARRVWMIAQLVMSIGVLLPAMVPGMAALALSALLVGGTFMIATMAGLEEAREVAGADATGLIAAMTAAFALGQIAGPVAATVAVRCTGSLSAALAAAAVLLFASALALRTRLAPHPARC